jgi:hypothetical protein
MQTRIFRSARARYYDDDILSGPAAYPDAYFAQAREHGFTDVWLRGILRDLAPTTVFPTLGREIARHQDALGTVVARAKAAGMGVYLYLNEPLGLAADDPFWRDHPDLRGITEYAADGWCMDDWAEAYALCTSTSAVRAWLREVTARLFHDLPDLAGWFCISASEHLTHCYAHGLDRCTAPAPRGCPRCAARDPLEVTADVLCDLHAGTRQSSATARTIAWDWSWSMYAPAPQTALLERLPQDMTLLLDWERGGTRTMPDGRANVVDEYSLAYVGPSPQFCAMHAEATRLGLSVMAKLQVGTTHELATVPNLPLVDRLFEKLSAVEAMGLDGVLATWNFGNGFSLNTAAVGRFAADPTRPSPREFVKALAESYFAIPDGTAVAEAIADFSAAMDYYPFDIPFLYWGIVNYALAYPLTPAPLAGTPTGPSWMMAERGDDLSKSLHQFTLEETIALLEETATRWQAAVARYRAALANSPRAAQELGVAATVGHIFRSAVHAYRVYQLRRDRPADLDAQFAAIVAAEIANLEAALPLLDADPRLGFHAECQGVMFSAALVREKLAALREAVKSNTATVDS